MKRPNNIPVLDSIQFFNKKVKVNTVINSQNCKSSSFPLKVLTLAAVLGCFRKCIIVACYLLFGNMCAWPWNLAGNRVRIGQTEPSPGDGGLELDPCLKATVWRH